MTAQPRLLISIWLCACLLLPQAVSAHPQPVSYTHIDFIESESGSEIEIAHRFEVHELMTHQEHCEIDPESGLQRFADDIHRSFRLLTPEGAPIEVELVGYERENRYIWVYRELFEPPQTLTMSFSSTDCLAHNHTSYLSIQHHTSDQQKRKIRDAVLQSGETLQISVPPQ